MSSAEEYDLWTGRSLNLSSLMPGLKEIKKKGVLLDLPSVACEEIKKEKVEKKKKRSKFPRDKALVYFREKKFYMMLSQPEDASDEGYVMSNRWFTPCKYILDEKSMDIPLFLQVPFEDRFTPHQPFYYMIRTKIIIPRTSIEQYLAKKDEEISFRHEHVTKAGSVILLSFNLDRISHTNQLQLYNFYIEIAQEPFLQR